jgi:beta-glucosidase-like glycosyl hydrolase
MSSLFRRLRALVAIASVLPVAACSSTPGEDDADQSDSAISFTGTPNEDIGQFFMIEHFGVEANGFNDVHGMVKRQNLGALILWNPTQASGETARQMVTRYAATAHDSKHAELFVAADQEERGTQRFKSRNGFTDLVDAATLGRVAAAQGNPRVCELHARITSREMSAAGMNMTLGTVSDVFTKNSGTPGMFRTRSIGPESSVVASCIAAMTKAYGAEKHVVFITKHFPGLGNASGNTDVDASVHTFSTTKDRMEQELAPYRAATASVNGDNTWPTFGAMVSHASYEILDASKSPATLSPVILEGLLRGSSSTELSLGGIDGAKQPAKFKGMDLKGLTVSDAFWTWGATKDLTPTEKRRLMARSFVAGMDILMIAKAEFIGAWDYFQQIFASQLPEAEQQALASAAHEPDFASFLAKFKARVGESAARIKAAKTAVGPAASFIKQGEARAASTDLVPEYRRLTQ